MEDFDESTSKYNMIEGIAHEADILMIKLRSRIPRIFRQSIGSLV